MFNDIVKEKNSSNDLGISFEEKAFYDILKAVAEKHEFEYPHDKLIKLSKEIKEIVDANDYSPVPNDEVFKEIFDQAENFKKYA